MVTDGATTLAEHAVHEVITLAEHLPLSGLQDLAKLVNEIYSGIALAKVRWARCRST